MKVKLYSLPTCPWCIKVKKFLKDNNVEFEDFDVGTDHKAAKEMIIKSGQKGVPVIDIDGKIIIGSDEEKLKKVLKL